MTEDTTFWVNLAEGAPWYVPLVIAGWFTLRPRIVEACAEFSRLVGAIEAVAERGIEVHHHHHDGQSVEVEATLREVRK